MTNRNLFHGAASLVFVVLLLCASESTRAQTDVQARPAAPRNRLPLGGIETRASRVYIFVDKSGFGHQHAVVGRIKEGKLRLAEKPAGRIVFDMKSFVADTSDARRYVGLEGETEEGTRQQVTQNMLGPDVLDAERFPTATFEVMTVKALDDKSENGKPQYQIEGQFTLHGATRPLDFTAEGVTEKGFLHLKAAFRLRQTEYKIRPFKKALGAVGVSDVLTVYGDLWVKQ